jgi:hypothetical protein
MNHRVEVIEGVLGGDAQRLMVEFFRERRTQIGPPKP